MKSFLLGICFLLGSQLYAQDLSPAQAANAKNVRKYVSVQGKVISVKKWDEGKSLGFGDNFVFINMEEDYPYNPIVVRIPFKYMANFPDTEKLKEKRIRVKGKIVMSKYINETKRRPSIELRNSSQLEILND
ncbi:MAG: hypothetical protein NW207_09405 [Cytophagales bacterium]|nr:hypothetical protein [Cytophagales bacterium]